MTEVEKLAKKHAQQPKQPKTTEAARLASAYVAGHASRDNEVAELKAKIAMLQLQLQDIYIRGEYYE